VTSGRRFLPSPLALESFEPYRTPDFERSGLLRLDINERPDGAPAYVIDALREALQPQQVATYPNYDEWMKHASRSFGVDRALILPTNGADEGIRAIIDAHQMPGTALVTHAPGFDMFALAARLHANPVVEVSFDVTGPARFEFADEPWFAALEASDPAPGVVAIATPNNPTGAIVPRSAIERTLAAVTCPVIVDETYGAFAGETCVDLVPAHPHLFVLRSFSKVHGLAGLRIGAVISQPQNISGLRRLLNPYNVNCAAVAASIACMKRPDDIAKHITEVLATRASFVDALRRMRFDVGVENANFVLVHVGEDHALLTAALRKQGVLIRDRHGSHPDLDGVVRIAIGSAGQMARVVGAFRRYLRLPPIIDALLLDLDGTLVDVRASYRRAIRETVRDLMASCGASDETIASVDDALVDQYKARGGLNNDWDCSQAICTDQGIEVSRDEVIDRFQQHYCGTNFNGFITDERWLFEPEAVALLGRFEGFGVVTGRPRAEAVWTLRRHLSGVDGALVAMEDTAEDKPHPEPVLRGQRLAGGRTAAYVGDSVDDMAAATAAGMFAVAVLGPGRAWQSGWPERLYLAGADVVFADINEAVAWLAREGD
jgi:histidinol-phosphate aminotransferase